MKKRFLRRRERLLTFKNDIESMHEKISNASKVEEKFTKLKDIQSQLKEKHREHSRLVGFFEE